MARPLACCSPRRKPSLDGKDELVGAVPRPTLTKGSNTSTPVPAVPRVSTPAPPDAAIATPSPAPALAATALSLDYKLFKQFMKAYLEVQVPGRTEVDPEPCKQLFKAQYLDFYYSNLHMDCYRFC